MTPASKTLRPKPLTPQARRERNREEMVTAILDAARDIMREEGAAALNIREVARRVGVQPPSLYAYFNGKMAIYDALFVMGIRLIRQRFREAAERTAHRSLADRHRAATEAYMAFALEYPELYQICFERPVPRFAPSEESMNESLAMLKENDRDIARILVEAGIDTGLPLAKARDLILAMTHGLTSLHMANEPDLPIGKGRFGSLIPAAVELFQKAWNPPTPPPKTKRR
jgi:AcrR family transcriptional regulator